MRKPRDNTAADARPALGSVRSDELLPLRVFCSRLGIGKKAWSILAHKGFPVLRSGKQCFIDGNAALAWFRQLSESG
jgi:hypothetical protein